MSSPKEDPFDSLSEFSSKLRHLHQVMTKSNYRPSLVFIMRDLRVLINSLQAECPKHHGVLAARVQWYKWLLAAFDEKYVQRWMAKDYDPEPDQVELDCLFDFMRRSYLRESFPDLFIDLRSLCRMATMYGPKNWPSYFKVKISELDQMLLDGRF